MTDTPHTLREGIAAIVDKHTGEWKAGHNHLIVDQILSLLEQEINKARVKQLEELVRLATDGKRKGQDDCIERETLEYLLKEALKPKNGGKS